MHGLFLALTITCLIAIIIGIIKPRTVLWWGTKKRYQINVLKYYVIGFVLFLVLFGLTANNSGTSDNKDSVGKPTITEPEKALPPVEQAAVEQIAEPPKYIIGATREQIRTMFSGWEYVPRYEQNVDPHAMKFQNNDLIVVVDFDSNMIAEGVSFLSNGKDFSYGELGDAVTGKGSYVDIHYNELVQWATGGENFKVDKDVTQYPVEIYIGNYHK